MKVKKSMPVLLLLILQLCGPVAFAQEVLTLEQAIRVALERNFEIRIAANNNRISENNVNLGNAGLLPRADALATDDWAIRSIRQTQLDGTVREQSNARSNNLNYGVALSWTVFDGFGMFARYEQLKELNKLGEANMQTTVLSRVADVIGTYFDLVQQQQQLRALDTAISISRLRVNTAQTRFEIGKAARLEVLNAQVDFNTDTTNLLRQRELYNNTRIQLNLIMAREPETIFTVEETFALNDKLTLAQLTEQAQQQNPVLQAAVINRRVAELDLRQVQAQRYPRVALSSGYNFTRSVTPLGFARESSGRGLTYGVQASVPLFNGFVQRRNEQNARILISNAELDYERLNQALKAQLTQAYQTYRTNLALVQLEESNQRIARQNLDITMEKFRLGTLTTVEFRDAQLNFLNATVRYSNAQYQAKLAEVGLREIAGNISL